MPDRPEAAGRRAEYPHRPGPVPAIVGGDGRVAAASEVDPTDASQSPDSGTPSEEREIPRRISVVISGDWHIPRPPEIDTGYPAHRPDATAEDTDIAPSVSVEVTGAAISVFAPK